MTPFLLFDAYGTLVELDDFYGRLQSAFARRGVVLPADVVRHAARREMGFYISQCMRARTPELYAIVRRECATVLAEAIVEQDRAMPLGQDDLVQVLSESLSFRAFPDVRPVLEELWRRKVPMGVLSNWDCQLPGVLREAKLDSFFRFVLTSAEAGVQKPAPEFFTRGVECAQSTHPGLALRDCVYIGDHYEKDVLGARVAGLIPLWLVRDRRDLASGEVHEAKDDVVRLESLKELSTALGRLRPARNHSE